MSGCVAFAALRNAIRKPSASSLGSAPSKSYSVPMVVLATISPSECPPTRSPPIDDALDNQRYLGGRMILLWQKHANRVGWLTAAGRGPPDWRPAGVVGGAVPPPVL